MIRSFRFRILLLLCIGIAYLYGPLFCHSLECAHIQEKNSELIKFLREQNHQRDSPCIFAAIKRLALTHDSRAVEVLIDYLDYFVPPDTPGTTGIYADRGGHARQLRH